VAALQLLHLANFMSPDVAVNVYDLSQYSIHLSHAPCGGVFPLYTYLEVND